MYIKQLSVFIENREGRLAEVLDILGKNNINIVSLSLADTTDYGMLRLIVPQPVLAREALKQNGFSAMLTDVLVIRLAHRVGQLQELLNVACKADINVEYMYALSTGRDDAAIVLKTSDLKKASEVLAADGVEIITTEDLKEWL